MAFNSSSGYCTGILQSFVSNLTSSYADQRNEASMVATSVVMFALATLFFNLNLFSGLSDMSAILNPSVRFFLSTSLSLFLPVMSYLFSEAKNEESGNNAGWTTTETELSFRARTILLWMLLVELLRKKVEAILVSVPGGYSGSIERAARIAWLGYLVFHNIRSAGKRALYGALWVLAAAKLVQRFVTLELGKRSFAYGKNPQLCAAYMDQILHEEQEQLLVDNNNNNNSNNGQQQLRGSELLKSCNYVVMGEEDLEKKAGPRGYRLILIEPITIRGQMVAKADSTVVTVGKIWNTEKMTLLFQKKQDPPGLKRLCLSLALCKLLRRMLEGFPITPLESQHCHRVIFDGLCHCQDDDDAAVALFQVLNDEVQFLSEYYHSVHPVVFSSPFFFLANYVLFPVVVSALCVLTAILSGYGDVLYAVHSFKNDNYVVANSVLKMTGCLLSRIAASPVNLFSAIDVFITMLLFLAFVYEEVWELIVFLLSNWFLVSLLCSHVTATSSTPAAGSGRILVGWAVRAILRVRRSTLMSRPSVSFKHFSLLWFCRLSWAPNTRAVPTEAKKAIMERMATNKPLSNGSASTLLQSSHHAELSWACESDSIADVILTWHIATVVLEAKQQQQNTEMPAAGASSAGGDRKVATALSGYCAYLVAFQPELLPDDKDGTERVYNDTMAEMKKKMGCWAYYCSTQEARVGKLMEIAAEAHDDTASTALRKGARLGKALVEKDRAHVWKLLAELWTEVLTYAAPAAGELHVKAHREALAHGGEFITLLWALATHTGIARPVATAGSVV
ncbi:hypothetical protein PR202_gb24705 [Eleusine coracana subsp. coracana]|uniref:DUF4220 domain-containing protein n=1 Tax=Eleusine coracana subsp. coracana TaxID=191504 RepID=A0AAV5FN41_ELECO|nr:hypothetical protein QOZ80_5BG0451410 [Eleusine coracana subsp. coracana]GJN35890.1 hypothetical protein PR202_gb24705 [Eleusine coracana subsp. coracana]